MVAVAIIGIVVAIGVPSFQRALERSRADIACANLRSIWAAERLFWLENQCYSGDLSSLQNASAFPDKVSLLDPNFNASDAAYTYTLGTTTTGFQATATPAPTNMCIGQFTIDESGGVAGAVYFPGWSTPIKPVSCW